MSSASLSVRSVSGRTGSRDWLDVPARVFAGDPVWVTPLRMVEKQRISPKHNPFFEHGEAQLFVAYRGGMPIGRISAQINRLHLAHHDDRTGHFGFFDCVDDPEAAAMLVCAARGWLRARGMTRMAGPVSFSINEDIGLLVAGFDQRPSILTSHAHRYSGPLLEASGLAKAIDLFAWRMQPREIPPMIQRLARLAGAASSRIRVRPFDMSCYEREVGVVFDIFNDAWSENWGFVPFTKTEVAKLARETRPIMRSDFGRIIELDGEPVAMIVMLPDINDLIGSFRGRLLPFN